MQTLFLMEELYGFIENIVFTNDSFTVAKLKEPRKIELTCIVGAMPALQAGETIRCRGTWKLHPEYGKQFEVQEFESTRPSDVIGIQKYLESGLIKGIGPIYAQRIVEMFGEKTLDIIDTSPRRLLEVAGIGEKRISRIEQCWQEQRSVREAMLFLRRHNISPIYAQKIFRAYGDQCIQKMTSDPFALAKDIQGIGFKTADSIAQGLGIPPDAGTRIDAGIEHTLWNACNEGHTCFPLSSLIENAIHLLEVSAEKIQGQIDLLLKKELLFQKDLFIWLRAIYLTEAGIAKEISRLKHCNSNLRPINTEKAIDWVQDKLRIVLAPEQKQAVIAAVSQKIHIITGGPGTGKSTITKAILAITEKLSDQILLAAPTGRAAKRMQQITGRKASTIHSLLEFQGIGFKKNRNDPLICDLLIIDEASMIDTQLIYALIRAIPSSARLILIGDIDQLPSVGAGNVLKDLIISKTISVTTLTQIFRQAQDSRIVTNAHKINNGEYPDLRYTSKSDFIFIEKEEPAAIVDTIVDLVTHRLSKQYHFHRFHDIQVLSPMKKGEIGSENLNFILQQKLNPSTTPLCRMGNTFHIGDKVMQMRNNYQKSIFNGDVGRILSIDWTEQVFSVAFEEKTIEYEFSEIDELSLAYAVSIHKYQGSECPCIIIPIHTSHFKLLHRNLIYTGITRGKKLVVLVGSKKAIGIAVRNNEVQQRYTGLVAQLLHSSHLTLS